MNKNKNKFQQLAIDLLKNVNIIKFIYIKHLAQFLNYLKINNIKINSLQQLEQEYPHMKILIDIFYKQENTIRACCADNNQPLLAELVIENLNNFLQNLLIQDESLPLGLKLAL